MRFVEACAAVTPRPFRSLARRARRATPAPGCRLGRGARSLVAAGAAGAAGAVAAAVATAVAAGLVVPGVPARASTPVAVGRTPSVWPTTSWSLPRSSDANEIDGSVTTAPIGGVEAAVFGTFAGTVDVVNVATGKELPGWPRQMAGGAGAQIWSTPAVAALDGAGRPPTIIVGSGTNTASVGEVEAFYANGAERFVFHVGHQPGTWTGVYSSPAVGDITGNGQQDVVFGSWDHNLYALTPAGKLVPGFPYNTADTVWSSPALFRLPGQRGMDIVVGHDASGLHGCRGGFIDDLRYVTGRGPVLRWSHCEPETIWSSPAVGVINGTGRPAVVVGTGYGYSSPFPAGSNRLYAYYADNGAPVPGWPVATDGAASSSPAIGVIAPSGAPAVVDAARDGTAATQVAAWSGSGRRLWSRVLPGTSPWLMASPVLVPLLDHASNDVLIGTQFGLSALDGVNGAPLYGTGARPLTCAATASPAVTQAPGGGPSAGWRVVVPCGGSVVGYPLPVVPKIPPAWPMFRQNPAHTGTA